jgi:hypothetical protein
MLEKKVKKLKLGQTDTIKGDLAYWLSRPSEERFAAVELLRKQYYGDIGRLQRVARVVKRTKR